MRIRALAAVAGVLFAVSGPLIAEEPPPAHVKSCADVRAYMDADGAMTMATFKTVLIAAGMEWGPQQDKALENQCMVTAYVKQAVLVQHVNRAIMVTARVVNEGGVCKLTNISLDGC
jgi:hypothetical protein